MSVYIIAQLKFNQREIYDRYQSRFFDVFKNFNGKLLVADEHPVLLEGEWPRDKVVIMEFPDANPRCDSMSRRSTRRSRWTARRERIRSC